MRDADILVSSENVYLEMSKTFRPTVSAALRRAAAVRNAAGEIVDDVLPRELRTWLRGHGRTGLPVRPGTVVATSPGALGAHGVRRIHHAAVSTPVGDGDRYHVAPAVLAEAVQASFALGRAERAELSLPLSTLCFPCWAPAAGTARRDRRPLAAVGPAPGTARGHLLVGHRGDGPAAPHRGRQGRQLASLSDTPVPRSARSARANSPRSGTPYRRSPMRRPAPAPGVTTAWSRAPVASRSRCGAYRTAPSAVRGRMRWLADPRHTRRVGSATRNRPVTTASAPASARS